jgi:hypothetical protein
MYKRETVQCRNGKNVTNPNVSASILQPESGGITFCFVLLSDIYRSSRTKYYVVTDGLVVHCNRAAVIAEKYDE